MYITEYLSIKKSSQGFQLLRGYPMLQAPAGPRETSGLPGSIRYQGVPFTAISFAGRSSKDYSASGGQVQPSFTRKPAIAPFRSSGCFSIAFE